MEHLNMKQPIAIIVGLSLLAVAGTIQAEPSSEVAWTVETRSLVRSGDAERGEAIAKKRKCLRCHGEAGFSRKSDVPHLAGQRASYLFKQLVDYKAKKRSYGKMNRAAKKLSEQDMADVAAYYAETSYKLAKQLEEAYQKAEGIDEDEEVAEVVTQIKPDNMLARKFVLKGDHSRMIPSCGSCHGRDGEGRDMDVPGLNGQQLENFIVTMEDFRAGERSNDIYSKMRTIAEVMTDQEIAILGHYYAGQE